MPLIAMTREMGSLGKDVARGVAERLGIQVVHHEIIDNLADKMRLRKSHVVRLLEGKASMFERLTADQTSLSIYTADETFSLAGGKGAVIRGWGATHLLRPVRHAVCVRICAPEALRIERMKQRLETDDDDFVAREVRASDEAHGAIMRRHFGINWQDSEYYDLVLNTERVSVEECTEQVVRLARHPDFTETPESAIKLSDLALESRIRAALRAAQETAQIRITVTVNGGVATLSGMVDTAAQSDRVATLVSAIAGIKTIDNALRSVSGIRSRREG